MGKHRWSYWEVGSYGPKGVWMKITTVLAKDAEAAKRVARKSLNRPGRHTLLQRWIHGGCEVLEQ